MRNMILPLYSDEFRDVFLSEVSDEEATQGHSYDLGDDHGYFICEIDRGNPSSGIGVLGKVASYEAALRLARLWPFRRGNTRPE